MSLWGNTVGSAQGHLLKRSGGDMTGAINMNGHPVTGLKAPESADQAANKKYVDDTVANSRKPYTVLLAADKWSGDVPYTQVVTQEEITKTDRPYYGPVYSADTQTRIREKAAYSCIDDLDTANGSMTFTCFDSKPDTDLVIQLEVFH